MVLTDVSGKDHAITHDLNFHNNRYEVKQVITFKNPKAPLLGALRGSGPVPGDPATDAGVNGASSSKKRQSGANETQKRKKPDTKGIDMDKLAEGLQKLGEDDLLQVVQMVHDNKSEESWMRNDVDRKSFDPFYLAVWPLRVQDSYRPFTLVVRPRASRISPWKLPPESEPALALRALVECLLMHSTLQRANFMSISTHYPTTSLKCSGTSQTSESLQLLRCLDKRHWIT